MIFILYLGVMVLMGIVLWATLLSRKSVREGTRVAAELLEEDRHVATAGKRAARKKQADREKKPARN